MTAELDPVIHPTHRLRICAILAEGSTVESAFVMAQLGLTASAFSKQVSALVDAGYLRQQRSRTDSRRVWLSLTGAGRRAYRGHVQALRDIVAGPPVGAVPPTVPADLEESR